jgi:hypothetical protein
MSGTVHELQGLAGFVPDDDQDGDELEAKAAALRLAIKMMH